MKTNGQRQTAQAKSAQAQTHNGSEPAQPQARSIFKIEHYAKRQRYTRLLNDTLRDTRLRPMAAQVLHYALTFPATWKLHSWHLRKVFGYGEESLCNAMKELVELGYALPKRGRGKGNKITDRYWLIRESVALPWPKTVTGVFRGTEKPGCKRTTDLKEQMNKEGEGPFQSAQHPTGSSELSRPPIETAALSFCPRYPYPSSPEEGYATLEAMGIEIYPDHDGNFFENMIANDWIIPGTGRPVYDWPATYVARLERSVPGGNY